MTAAVTERPIPTGEGLTFEKVWAMFQETDKKFKETDKKFQETDKRFQETDRQFKETDKKLQETERLMKENAEKLDKQLEKSKRLVDRNGRQMGGLHRKFGELAEHLVAPGIAKRFNELGYHFAAMAPRGYKIVEDEKIKTEIDILLENGETVIAVEVKVNPAVQDIEHHVKRLEILRDSRLKANEKRKKILGAIAGAIYEDKVKEAVREAGFFVIEQSGDTMKIDMTEDFVPREW
jgi:chromosome segregation ATPase